MPGPLTLETAAFVARFRSWDTTVAGTEDERFEKTRLGRDRSLGSLHAALALALRGEVIEAKLLSDRLSAILWDEKSFFAVRASEEILGLYPCEAFLECFAAVRALDVHGYEFDVDALHGWPVLAVAYRHTGLSDDARDDDSRQFEQAAA